MPELKVNPRPGSPLYLAAAEALLAAIERGRFAPGEKLPSTADLAPRLGTALATTHRALQELVSRGVLRRAQGLGTFVHESFTARSARATGLRIAVLLPDGPALADPHTAAILEGARQAAHTLGVDLALPAHHEDPRRECRAYLFINPAPGQLDHDLRFARHTREPNDGLPVAVVGARSSRPNWASFDTDPAALARAAAEHFHHLGHRRLALAADASRHRDADLGAAFAAHAARLGATLPAPPAAPPAPADDLDRLLARRDRPTALLATSAHAAAAAYRAARRAGLAIPRDLSILAADDPPSADLWDPPLSAFRHPLDQLGRAAVQSLFETVVRAQRPTPTTVLHAELTPRKSTAPLRR